MEFSKYQQEAARTDQRPGSALEDITIPLLGLAGEAGSLLTEFKKQLRDGTSYLGFRDHVREELGDLLWYIANLGTKTGLDLNDIAVGNLQKNSQRWASDPATYRLLDTRFPKKERLPRSFRVEIREVRRGQKVRVVLTMDGRKIGDELTDNAYSDDGYRFHDVFHLAYAAILGWSPVARKLFDCKRRSRSLIDEVEDGGRAAVIDEAIAALVFDYAREHSFLEGLETVDYALLSRIKTLAQHLEVKQRTLNDWQRAIVEGYRVWRDVRTTRGGVVIGNLKKRIIEYHPRSRRAAYSGHRK